MIIKEHKGIKVGCKARVVKGMGIKGFTTGDLVTVDNIYIDHDGDYMVCFTSSEASYFSGCFLNRFEPINTSKLKEKLKEFVYV